MLAAFRGYTIQIQLPRSGGITNVCGGLGGHTPRYYARNHHPHIDLWSKRWCRDVRGGTSRLYQRRLRLAGTPSLMSGNVFLIRGGATSKPLSCCQHRDGVHNEGACSHGGKMMLSEVPTCNVIALTKDNTFCSRTQAALSGWLH